ncbi:MAG: hypothetical protein H6841_06580 [Planctomycetes bacterium]|nr:hypothetical protein [Planctomycetota bacterium]
METHTRPTRKYPYNPPSDLHGTLGALQLEVRVDLRHPDRELHTSSGSGSVIFSGGNWESEVIWTAVQILEHDLERDRKSITEALRRIADRLELE